MRNVLLAMGLASALILVGCKKTEEAAPAAEPAAPAEAAPAMEAPAPEAAPAEAAPAEAAPAETPAS